jgi:hypothetical protein
VGSQWHEPAADMLGFNVASTDVTAASAGAYPQSTSGLESLETPLDNLPKFSTPEAYSQLDTAQTIDDVKDTDHVRLDSRLENVDFGKAFDGSTAPPMNSVVTYLPDTGSGQPDPRELAKPTGSRTRLTQQGWGCSYSGLATVKVTITNLTHGTKEWDLRKTVISVWDENPWLNPSPIAYGYTDDSGNFTFPMPSCDFGAFWDYSRPDIYFMIQSIDAYQIGVWNIFTPLLYASTYAVRTGTFWDTTANTFAVNLVAGNSDSENAMWLLNMVQLAQNYNVAAGGDGSSYFPVRITWPSRLNFCAWEQMTNVCLAFGPTQSTSFALISKMEILGREWSSTYTAWHEFGHEMMYRTSNDAGYQLAYFRGPHEILQIIPQFAFGGHNLTEQQNPTLAYNEGFANYFYVMLQDHYGIPSPNYGFRDCNSSFCAYPSGNENESRVSTFLYRYSRSH